MIVYKRRQPVLFLGVKTVVAMIHAIVKGMHYL